MYFRRTTKCHFNNKTNVFLTFTFLHFCPCLFLPVSRFSFCSFFFSENLARIQEFHGIPTQSSSYGDDLYKATNAVDGKFEEDGEKTSCSYTVGGKQNTWAWWKLPLTKLCFVEYLLIYFRSGST